MQNDMEAINRKILDRRRANRSMPPYRAALIPEVTEILSNYFAAIKPGASVSGVRRVGGGASKEQVSNAFKIILGDPNVKGILVNIFGGIMDCNVIAEGIVAAVQEVGLGLPLVVRLEGNNVDAGKKTLAESGLNLVSGDGLTDAAAKIVKAVAA